MDQLLRDLIHAHGVSGHEGPVREIIEKNIKKYVSEVDVDKMGNLIALKKGKKPRIMLAAHMDEVGLIVKSISSDGRIRFTEIGSIDPLTLVGQRAHIQTENEVVHGVISTQEMTDGNIIIEKLPQMTDMFIDTGLDKQELEARGITIGNFIDLDQESGVLGNNDTIYGKALDDRIGCYVLIEVAKKLKKNACEIAFVFTVQEEVGLYGAMTSAYELDPDWAIAVDVTNTYESKNLRELGKGPTVTIKDAELIGNPVVNKWIKDAAKRKKIPIQLDVSDMGTTDALNISISKGGVPTASMGVPIKNIHSTVGMASLKDINHLIEVLVELLQKPPREKVV